MHREFFYLCAVARPTDLRGLGKKGGTAANRSGWGEGPKQKIDARLGGVPLDLLHVAVRGPVRIEVKEEEAPPAVEAGYCVDGGERQPLRRVGARWEAELATEDLAEGRHTIAVELDFGSGKRESTRGAFLLRRRAM